MSESQQFWAGYYKKIYRQVNGKPVPWLDYSNELVQAQTFGLLLEAAGPLHGRRCMDVGCGWGQLSLSVRAMGGNVVAIDIVDEMIGELRQLHPGVKWIAGSFLDPVVLEAEGQFDVIFAAEVLQYTPLKDAVEVLWRHISPGGRLIGVIPNASCPIVQKTMTRFNGKYHAVTESLLADNINRLPSLELWMMRGMVFGADQRLWPYEVTPWTSEWEHWEAIPNRLLFVARKDVTD
jgi:2-polyprenyl-3-methyl-5-hydroxy-6-metoxy-1,4-benzoquinol methylase